MPRFDLQNALKIAILYALAFACSLLAKIPFLEIFWSLYIPITAAANFLLFDSLVEVIDFEEMKKLEGQTKALYILALAILAGSFAVASVIFLK
jgi:hypothetical protein